MVGISALTYSDLVWMFSNSFYFPEYCYLVNCLSQVKENTETLDGFQALLSDPSRAPPESDMKDGPDGTAFMISSKVEP
ncbi:hypothetical protein LIER_19936 [Lithospermum erythrorhizon]|uniref:Uncharacterized protein n=1 Tax=Lithospermum erythrorhizon TaxID=34254 RepID=A0AAV3QNA1_LITER